MDEKSIVSYMKKNDFLFEHGDLLPAFFELTLIHFSKPFNNVDAYSLGFSYIGAGEGDYISATKEHPLIGKFVLDKYQNNVGLLHDEFSLWRKKFLSLQKEYFSLFTKDFSSLSIGELKKVHAIIFDMFMDVRIPGFLDAFNFFMDDYFTKEISLFAQKNDFDVQELSVDIFAAVEPSFIKEREHSIIAIINRLKKDGVSKDAIDCSSADIVSHLLRFSYSFSYYAKYIPYTKELFLEEVDDLWDACVEENISFPALVKKYSLPISLYSLIDIVLVFGKWQDMRKEFSQMYVTLKSLLFTVFSEKTSLPFEVFTYALQSEVDALLDGLVSVDTVLKRKEGVLFVHQDGILSLLCTGVKAKKYLGFLHSDNDITITKVSGFVASPGCVTGKVTIVLSKKELDKMNKGDVLVAPMTRPEFLSAMKKASAIVTDDGGVTCHAAIVSRELQKPCIIGTKIATKVLKDGMVVEVDANHGLVRIIEQ